MASLKCTIRFGDGAMVTAEGKSESAETEVPVVYGGAVERLSGPFAECTLGFLEWWMRHQAKMLGVEIEVSGEGEYERWAE